MGDHSFVTLNRSYVKYKTLRIEEDMCHEFKGHMNICVENLPPWCFNPGTDKRSRRAVSRTICGFLNSGRGGIVYLGVTNDATVRGLFLTNFQRDHLVVSVQDLLSRYQPVASRDLVKVDFVPIRLEKESMAQWKELYREPEVKQSERLRSHTLRTYHSCWCDEEARCRRLIRRIPLFVVEITVFPWKASVSRVLLSAEENWPSRTAVACCELSPFHQDEEGRCYLRYHGGMQQLSAQDVVEITRQEMQAYYQPIVDCLRQQLSSASFLLEDDQITTAP